MTAARNTDASQRVATTKIPNPMTPRTKRRFGPMPTAAVRTHHAARKRATLLPDTATKWVRPERRKASRSRAPRPDVSPIKKPATRASERWLISSTDRTRSRTALPMVNSGPPPVPSTSTSEIVTRPAIGSPRIRPGMLLDVPTIRTRCPATRGVPWFGPTPTAGPAHGTHPPASRRASGPTTAGRCGPSSSATTPTNSIGPDGISLSRVAAIRLAAKKPDIAPATSRTMSTDAAGHRRATTIATIASPTAAMSPKRSPSNAPAQRTGSGQRPSTGPGGYPHLRRRDRVADRSELRFADTADVQQVFDRRERTMEIPVGDDPTCQYRPHTRKTFELHSRRTIQVDPPILGLAGRCRSADQRYHDLITVAHDDARFRPARSAPATAPPAPAIASATRADEEMVTSPAG